MSWTNYIFDYKYLCRQVSILCQLFSDDQMRYGCVWLLGPERVERPVLTPQSTRSVRAVWGQVGRINSRQTLTFQLQFRSATHSTVTKYWATLVHFIITHWPRGAGQSQCYSWTKCSAWTQWKWLYVIWLKRQMIQNILLQCYFRVVSSIHSKKKALKFTFSGEITARTAHHMATADTSVLRAAQWTSELDYDCVVLKSVGRVLVVYILCQD